MLKSFGLVAGAVLVGLAGVANGAVFNTVSTYDSAATNSNQVDRDATGNLGTFTTSVAVAHAANLGGVVTFDGSGTTNPGSPINGGDTYTDSGLISARYGAGLGKTLAVTTGTYNVQFSTNIRAISGNANSGTGLFLFANPAVQVESYTFGAISGGLPGEKVTQAGLTLLTRNGGGTPTITVTAFYSNLTSQSAAAAFTVTTTPDQDTFYGFTAPLGASITKLEVNYGATGDLRRGIDDFAFITSAAVPEPTSFALLAVGGLSALARRRRA